MTITEDLFVDISKHMADQQDNTTALSVPHMLISGQFKRIDFIPALEKALGQRLPDLTNSRANAQVIQIFKDRSLPLPSVQTLPRLLDKLCGEYLEVQCEGPTFIMNHPECLSPLSKSFKHPTCGQTVSARAELFIQSKEIVNMYEEENSPFEQRRKFEDQLAFQEEGESSAVNDHFVQALQWGLPPTGGWGCGIDRLVMLFTGTSKIDDVLTFGNLRRVTRQ